MIYKPLFYWPKTVGGLEDTFRVVVNGATYVCTIMLGTYGRLTDLLDAIRAALDAAYPSYEWAVRLDKSGRLVLCADGPFSWYRDGGAAESLWLGVGYLLGSGATKAAVVDPAREFPKNSGGYALLADRPLGNVFAPDVALLADSEDYDENANHAVTIAESGAVKLISDVSLVRRDVSLGFLTDALTFGGPDRVGAYDESLKRLIVGAVAAGRVELHQLADDEFVEALNNNWIGDPGFEKLQSWFGGSNAGGSGTTLTYTSDPALAHTGNGSMLFDNPTAATVQFEYRGAPLGAAGFRIDVRAGDVATLKAWVRASGGNARIILSAQQRNNGSSVLTGSAVMSSGVYAQLTAQLTGRDDLITFYIAINVDAGAAGRFDDFTLNIDRVPRRGGYYVLDAESVLGGFRPERMGTQRRLWAHNLRLRKWVA